MKEWITLSSHELQRAQVLEQVFRGALSLKEATVMMKLSYRQAKRPLARYRKDRPKSPAHRSLGRAAPNTLGPETRDRVLMLHREAYAQFNDTIFVEMLREGHNRQLEAWNKTYNYIRPHQSLGYQTPHEFFQNWLKEHKQSRYH